MGVEVVGYETAPSSTEAEKTGLHENGTNEHIKFGSHENGEDNKVSSGNFPKDAADEWPEPQQIHYFYFVRFKPYDNPEIRAKIDSGFKEFHRLGQAEFQVLDKLKLKQSERREIKDQLRPLKQKNREFYDSMYKTRKDLEPLQEKLGDLRSGMAAGRGSGLFTSEKELNEVIQSLNYRIQHETIPLTEEKQILRQIKQLESTRNEVIAIAAKRADSRAELEKEGYEEQVKLINVSLDEVRKDQQPLKERINSLEGPLRELEEEINNLETLLYETRAKKQTANEEIQKLKKMREEGNKDYNEYRKHINDAKEFAVKKDVRALQELWHREVEEFMSRWKANKSFRLDYEKRLLQSLDARQMSKDGRTRNPDEKPLVVVELVSTPPPKTESTVFKLKEKSKPAPQKETVPAAIKVVQKEAEKLSESKEKEETGSRKPGGDDSLLVVSEVVDVETLRETKREEQIAKAKQALERKKKLAEKNAAKAAVKAQNEAEKKLKEQEKKAAKKKGATSAPVEEQTDEEAVMLEKVDPTPKASVAAVKEKVRKDRSTTTSVRYRGKPRGSESIPKIIPKRKKSTNYRVWGTAAAAAVALFVILIALGYRYLL